MILLGLVGRARCGKTSIANAIVEYSRGQDFVAKIYDIGAEVLQYCIASGMIENKLREDLTPEEIQILVRVGKECRESDQDFWIRPLMKKLAEEEPEVAIIPNIRYLNETEWVKDYRGYNVRVTRLNENGSCFISTDRDPNHDSETQLQDFNADYHITVKDGDQILAEEQAITLFVYLKGLLEE